MSDTKEMTAPIASVGADAGQSLTKDNISITDEDAEYKKKLLEIQRFCDPMHLNTLSMNDLFDCSFTTAGGRAEDRQVVPRRPARLSRQHGTNALGVPRAARWGTVSGTGG